MPRKKTVAEKPTAEKKSHVTATPVKPDICKVEPRDLTDEELVVRSSILLVRELATELREADGGRCYICDEWSGHKQSCKIYKVVANALSYMEMKGISWE